MKKRIQYRQCTLRKRLSSENSSHSIVQVAYIPSTFACLNRFVRIKGDDGEWSDHWRVEGVGMSIWSDDLPDSHKAIKRHRQSTGDMLPRNHK